MTNGFTRWAAGRCGAIVLIWSATCCLAGAAGRGTPAAMTLSLILPPHRLPPLTERVMQKELVQVWASEGVRITWRKSEAEVPPGDRFIRLTLIGEEARSHGRNEHYVLGDFLPNEGRIRVSMFAASQAAYTSVAPRRGREPFAYPLALGYILGRAIAHEVGHALLGTEHAETGLMQAAFNPQFMAESPSDRFRLTPAESSRLLRYRFDARTATEPTIGDGAPPEVGSVAPASTR